MKKMKYVFMAMLSILLWIGCENDGFYYHDEPRVRLVGPDIWTVGTDSLLFSFMPYPTDTLTVTMNVQAWVIGETVDYARMLNLTVDEERSTASKDLYDFPKTVTIPADTNAATFHVILKRAAILQEKEVSLYLKVIPSDDFAVGVEEWDHLLFKWNDILTRPSNWDTAWSPYFGEYSDAKYRFMVSHAKEVIDPETMSWAQLTYYRIHFVNELNAYNAAHPNNPLAEGNKLIEFPN